MKNITRNQEDYLKAIYELGGKNKIIGNKLIREALSVSAPSVSEMINKLLKDGYVEYTSYQGVKLTPLGIEKAMKIRRKHLLWEVFLVEKLGYDWEDVHMEAEALEHVTSSKLEEALDNYLNHPKFCPHGSPIVSKEEDDNIQYRSLDNLNINQISIITKVDDKPETLRYIKENNLKFGDEVQLTAKDIQEGTISIVKEDEEIKLEIKFAKHIYVR